MAFVFSSWKHLAAGEDDAMPQALRVEFCGRVTPGVIPRFRNLGEDVWRELRDTCEVSLDEIDAATDHFVVRGIHRRELRTVMARVQSLLDRHFFTGTVKLVPVAQMDEDGP